MRLHETTGAGISQRMLAAKRIARDNGLGELTLPDERDATATESLADLYQPINWHDLWASTSSEPDWLVPGLIERGRLHAIYAPKKHKKSLLTLVMVAALGTGSPLLGRSNPHGRPLRVLYLDFENAPDDIRQRLEDAGYGPGDLANLIFLSFPKLPGLDTALGGAHLLALVERYRPDLLIVDSTSRVVTGKENDADTFRAFYRHTLAPIKVTGTAVLRLDNAGKDVTQGQRGSSAKGDDLDTAWMVTMASDDRITLRLDFQRSNHHPERIELVRHLHPLRFVRIDSATDRPEITALLADLEALGVAPDAVVRPREWPSPAPGSRSRITFSTRPSRSVRAVPKINAQLPQKTITQRSFTAVRTTMRRQP